MAINNFNEALTQFSPYVPKIKLQGTYTSSQVVTLPANTQYVFALVVGAGGGGSAPASTFSVGAGGGAGGINWGLFPVFGSTSINVIVGAGGTGATYTGSINYGGKGGDSSADAIYAGGGAGGYFGINNPSNGLYTQPWWGGGVKSSGYELTGSQFWSDVPMQWGFPNAISGLSGTGLGSMFWHTTNSSSTNYDYFPTYLGGVIANTFAPLVGNGGGNTVGGAGVSSVYFSGGTAAGNSAGGGGAGWTGNGSNISGSTGGAGGTGGGGGGAGGSATNGANGGAGYVELYW